MKKGIYYMLLIIYVFVTSIILISAIFAFYWILIPCELHIKILAISVYPLTLIIGATQNQTFKYFDSKLDIL